MRVPPSSEDLSNITKFVRASVDVTEAP